MSLMREIEWESCLFEPQSDRALEQRLRRETGRASSTLGYFVDCPWAAEAMARLNACLLKHTVLAHDLADQVGLVVSQDNSCRYCFAMQRVLLRVVGMSQARISQLEQDFRGAELSARERAAFDFARRMSRSNPLPRLADLHALSAAGFSELEIRELAATVALMVLFNRVSTLLAIPPQATETLPDRWYVRPFIGLARPYVRRLHGRAQPQPLSEAQKQGSYAFAICSLDPLPAASELRSALDGMEASTILSRRAKAFVFAVVARALGAADFEQEALRLLGQEGCHAATAAEVLAHLASPSLDEVERVAVPFARETVWYEAAPLQRRARQVLDALGRPRFVELIMVCALANAVCRLGIVAQKR